MEMERRHIPANGPDARRIIGFNRQIEAAVLRFFSEKVATAGDKKARNVGMREAKNNQVPEVRSRESVAERD